MIRGLFAGAVVFCFLLFLENAEADLIHGKDYQSPNGDQVVRVNSSGQVTTTLLAGEDQTNGVMKVEGQFSYKAIPHADTQVKATAGFIHTISCVSDAAATAGSIILYDSAAESGTVVWTMNLGAVPYFFSATLDMVMGTGIYVGFTTTADVDCTVSYR